MERIDPRPTVGQVLGQLDAEGAPGLRDRDRAREALLHRGDAEAPMPWYVRLLMGGGAWVSTLFVLGFLGSTGVLRQGASSVALGALCAGAGLVVRRSSSSDFLVQLALSMSLTGRLMIYAGLAEHGDGGNDAAAAAVALTVELIMAAVYPDTVNRFVSTLGAWSALLSLLHIAGAPRPVFDAAAGLLALAASLLWLGQAKLVRGAMGERHAPVAFGLSFALLASLLGLWWAPGEGKAVWLTSALIGLTGLGVGAAILRELRVEAPGVRATVAAVTAALALVALGSPGVSAALLLMALGFHRRNPPLLAMAAGFLAIFGVKFYYDLALTLLQKSGALLGSGLLLLGARALVERRRAS